MAIHEKFHLIIEKDRTARTGLDEIRADQLSARAKRKLGLLKQARQIRQESDDGWIEYKWKICDFNDGIKRKEKLASQMTFRLYEGEGKAVYNIGFTDDGRPIGLSYEKMLESLGHFKELVDTVRAQIKTTKIFQGSEPDSYCANILIEKGQVRTHSCFGCEDIHSSSSFPNDF